MGEIQLAADGKMVTGRGALICAKVMVKMLEDGWEKDDLPELERIFWTVRDSRGKVFYSTKDLHTEKD